MRIPFLPACWLLTAAFCLQAPGARAGDPPPGKPAAAPPPSSPPVAALPERPGHDLVWHDEFDTDGAPDPKRWKPFIGISKPKSIVCFTSRAENLRVEKGSLILEARAGAFRNPRHNPRSKWPADLVESLDYTSARVQTDGLAESLHGRIECRVKLPVARGTHCALWTMGADYAKVNWPRCGEIDILEHLGRDPATAWHVTHRAGDDGKDISRSSAVKNSGLNDGQFHVLAVDWDADRIVWSIDGKETWRMPLDEATLKDGGNAFRRPHFLIMDLSLGGWGGDPDPASFPVRMEVDYVRVYRRRP